MPFSVIKRSKPFSLPAHTSLPLMSSRRGKSAFNLETFLILQFYYGGQNRLTEIYNLFIIILVDNDDIGKIY